MSHGIESFLQAGERKSPAADSWDAGYIVPALWVHYYVGIVFILCICVAMLYVVRWVVKP